MAYDIIKEQNQLKISDQRFCLDVKSWSKYSNKIKFAWNTIKFDISNKNKIPDDPGIYAFFVKPGIAYFPEHAFLMYIGKAGDKSKNSLRKRFVQYINGMKTSKRPKLNWFLKTWESHLYFCYAKITDKRYSLSKIEMELNDSFIPPFNEMDFSAEIRRKIKVLR